MQARGLPQFHEPHVLAAECRQLLEETTSQPIHAVKARLEGAKCQGPCTNVWTAGCLAVRCKVRNIHGEACTGIYIFFIPDTMDVSSKKRIHLKKMNSSPSTNKLTEGERGHKKNQLQLTEETGELKIEHGQGI